MTFALVVCPPALAAEPVQTFELEDHLGFEWERELVSFPLNERAAARTSAELRLLSPEGELVPFQFAQRDGERVIAFQADVPELEAVSYDLVATTDAQAPATDVNVQEREGIVRLTNGRTGIELVADIAQAQHGPIRRLLLSDGSWVGEGELPEALSISDYEARITARGPVYGEVECTYRFSEAGTWRLRFRLITGEPMVLIREWSDMDGEKAWRFTLPADAAPTHLLSRVGTDQRHKPMRKDSLTMAEVKDSEKAQSWTLRPWHLWWNHRDGVAYEMMRVPAHMRVEQTEEEKKHSWNWIVQDGDAPTNGDVAPQIASIMVGAGNAGDWAEPRQRGGRNHAIQLRSSPDGAFALQMPLQAPGRHWFIGAYTIDRAEFAYDELTDAHAMVVKHFDRPLDRIKRWVLDWPSDPGTPYPRVFPGDDELAQMRRNDREIGFDLRNHRRALKQFILNQPTDSDRPARLAENAVNQSYQSAAGIFLDASPTIGQGRNSAINSAQHHIGRRVQNAAIAADLALGYGDLSEQQRDLIRARLALTAYYIAGDHVVSPERGMAALQNMTAMMYGGLGLVASVIPDHPRAPDWAQITSDEFDRQLDNWVGPNGSWIEAPHYQLGSLDSMLMFGLAAQRAGVNDFIFDERIKKAVLFLAKISTPRDPRFHDYRHLPPIGNTYLMETSDVFALLASVYEQRDPAYARTMQWMWHEQGKPALLVIGGDATTHWLNDFLYRDIEPAQPEWRSELFPSFGAVLRHGFGTEHETYMVYHQGPFAGHYDIDQGSFEMWGKGQPLMLDWGYNGRMPAWMHNTATISRRGRIELFDSQPTSDLIEGQQANWRRRILFVKDARAEGPAYFVIQDRFDENLRSDDESLWYWFYTDQTPQRDGQTVRVAGQHGVDLDVWLDANAEGDRATERVKTRVETSDAVQGRDKQYWTRGETTQHGMQIPLSAGQTVTAVLFPRDHDSRSPTITTFADGDGLRIETSAGTDYVFLGDEPTQAQDGQARFHGRVGVIQRRDGSTHMTIHDGESIHFGDASLVRDEGQTKRVAD